jgi:hypothetical protein
LLPSPVVIGEGIATLSALDVTPGTARDRFDRLG